MKSMNHFATATAILGVASASFAEITISVADMNFGHQNLKTPFPGASSAFGVSFLNYVVGKGGGNNRFIRPIIPFPRSGFDSIAGLPLTSATLHFSITNNLTELGESFDSEVRLFTTTETSLTSANRQVFAGLTGDGGDHAVVGSYLLADHLAGFQSLEFSPVALDALFDAINGTDPTIGIAFREFFSDDLDEFVFGIPPGVMMIEVTAVPGAGAMAPLALGAWVLGRRRRRGGPMKVRSGDVPGSPSRMARKKDTVLTKTVHLVTAASILGVASASSAEITISVADVQFSSQNLRVPFVGASSAFGVTHGTYGVGIIGVNSSLNRPIIPFPRSSFEAIAGLPLMSATLHFLISQNSTELGESFNSEIRLFTTAETDLRTANAQVFAGLTGDGGDHAVVGSLVLSDDLAGSQSMEFSSIALDALFDAINGTDATIGIAFLEFFSDDQDLFYFGIPPGVMMIEVTAVPGAGTLALMALGGSVVARPRRRGTACLDRVFHHR